MTRPQAMRFAQDMYADGEGWGIEEIRRHLAERGVLGVSGRPLAWDTVRRWADPSYEARKRDLDRVRKRENYRRSHHVKAFRVMDDMAEAAKVDRLLELRDCGVSFASLVKIIALDFGDHLTVEQVRYAVSTRRWPKSQRGELVAA